MALQKSLLVLAFSVVMAGTAWAQACPPDVVPVTVSFLNGIWTTEDGADAAQAAIMKILMSDSRWARVKTECVQFAKVYNKLTFLGVGDLEQALTQYAGGDLSEGLRFLSGLSNPTAAFGAGMIALATQVDIATCFATGNDCDSLLNAIKTRAESERRRKIVVAHSQGNFYWNEIFADLPADSALLTTVAVATPAAQVAGGGRYVNLSLDPVARLSPLLSSNADNGFSGSCTLLSALALFFPCHYFSESYLYDRSDSFNQILDAIFAELPTNGTSDRPGTITVNAVVDGQPWTGLVDFNVVGPSVTLISQPPLPTVDVDMPVGQYRLSTNGAPSGTVFAGVLPSDTQILRGGETITFTMVFTTSTAPGTVVVGALLDGKPWTGSIDAFIVAPTSVLFEQQAPSIYGDQQVGQYTMSFRSGGPTSASLVGIQPAPSQVLTGGQTITFTLQFSSQNKPPTAGFSMTDGSQLVLNGGTLNAFADPTTGEARIALTDQSSDTDGTIIKRVWKVNTQTAPLSVGLSSFIWGFTPGGPYLITLTVTDNSGLSASTSATINVSPAAPTITGITPSSILAGPNDQTVVFSGSGFQPGLTFSVGLPGGGTSTLSGAQIVSVGPTSIGALVTFADPGPYTFTVRNPDGGTSSSFSVTVASSAIGPAATLFPGQVLRVRFRTNPPFIASGLGAVTPDYIGLTLGAFPFDGLGMTATGIPTVTFTLLDGQAVLGQVSQVVVTNPSIQPYVSSDAEFKSLSSRLALTESVVVSFTSILDGTIDGLIEIRINQGSLILRLERWPAGDVYPILIAPQGCTVSGCGGTGADGWLTVSSVTIQ